MNGLSRPDVVLAVIAIASFTIALSATAFMLAIRRSRRAAARRALASITVPDAAAAMAGQPYADLKLRLIHTVGVDPKAGRP